jgi:3-oxoadipate enol-lactonase
VFVYDNDFTAPWSEPEVVLLHHGLFRTGEFWRSWVPYLGHRYRVLRPDLPGNGKSRELVPEDGYSTESLVASYVALLDELSIHKVHWVGEAMGTPIGAAVAGRHPGRISSLTSLDSPPGGLDLAVQKSMALDYDSWEDAIRELGVRNWWLRCRRATNMAMGDPRIDNWMADQAGQMSTEAAIAEVNWATAWRWDDLLPRVKAPVLFVWPKVPRHTVLSRQQDTEDARLRVVALASDGRQHLVEGGWPAWAPLNPEILVPIVMGFLHECAAHSASGILE